MRRVTATLLTLGVVCAAGLLAGCNERLDDPTTSEGILSIEKVEPVVVEADVTATDPNGNPQTLSDDTTVISVKNRPRNPSAGQFSDIFISKTEQFCTFAGATIISKTGLASFTIPSGATAQVTVVAVTVAEKTTLPALGDSWDCFVRMEGEDLAGNPATTDFASFAVSFVNG